jgi:SAM-dependent methyltransferase
MNPVERLRLIRERELNRVKTYLRPGISVLELGGNNGYQADLISKMGCEVTSIDIKIPPGDKLFPVQVYDGSKIPLANLSVDIVFSSNVLEHVKDLPALLADTRRVLKPSGLSLHILPTPAWRFWTSLASYVFAIQVMRSGKQVNTSWGGTGTIKKGGALGAIRARGLLGPPHGEFSSAAAELTGFSRRRWCQIFRRCGFEVIRAFPMGLTYTGYGILPWGSLKVRQFISGILGSSTHCFVLKAN